MSVTADSIPLSFTALLAFVSEKDASVLFDLSVTGNFVLKEQLTIDGQQQMWFNLALTFPGNNLNLQIPSEYAGVNIQVLTNLLNDNLKTYLDKSPFLLFKDGISIYKSFTHYLGTKYIAGQGLLVKGNDTSSVTVESKQLKFLN